MRVATMVLMLMLGLGLGKNSRLRAQDCRGEKVAFHWIWGIQVAAQDDERAVHGTSPRKVHGASESAFLI